MSNPLPGQLSFWEAPRQGRTGEDLRRELLASFATDREDEEKTGAELRDADIALLADRFWEKVHKSDGCWTWTAGRSTTGYGQLSRPRNMAGSRKVFAHRFSWFLHYGSIPPETPFVLHRCDNPLCVRPLHLRLGTHAENMADMVSKGRQQHGDRHYTRTHPEKCLRGDNAPGARLNEEQVRTIRRLRVDERWTEKRLAAEFGVSRGAVNNILRRTTWAHVP